MDRRLAGALVLVAALVAVLVMPSLAGRRVAGAPLASTFPDPPMVGTCLLDPVPEESVNFGVPPEIAVTAASFGPCEGSIGGEVVATWAELSAAEQAPSSRLGGPCYLQAASFAGLEPSGRSTDLPGAPSGGPAIWKPSIGMDAFLVVPGVREQNAGRTWRACLAVPVARTSYQGTLRAAFTTGDMPDEFGLCWQGVDLDLLPKLVPCDEPHPAELLATGFIRDRLQAPTEVIESSCVQIAARVMHTDDPTRGGVLRVVADRHSGGSASRDDSPLTIGCFVTTTGEQELSGTVIGLGDDPVPLRQ
jgi:hypothetical protein